MSGLVPCKFFSRGSCRYGDSCKFYHNRGDVSGAGGTSNYFGGNSFQILSPGNFRPPQQGHIQQQQSPFNNRQQQQGYNNKAAETLVQLEEATVKDMKEWSISKMWPLSVYAPISQKACLPGFEDYSPEELRLSWLQHGRQPPPDLLPRLQKVNELWMLYQQPNQNTRTILDRLIKGATTEQIANEFNLSTHPSQTQWNSLSNPSQSGGLFNQGTQPQGGFHTNPVAPSSSGLWSQPQTSFLGGNQPLNSNIFNTVTSTGGDTMDASELASGLFNPLQSSMSTTSFLNPSLTSIQPVQPQQTEFHFGLDGRNNPAANSVPGIGSGTPFLPTYSQSVQQPVQQPQQSIFGGNAFGDSVSKPLMGFNTQQQQPVGKYVYSDESALTDEEKASFLALTFDVIPLKPPPKSCCL